MNNQNAVPGNGRVVRRLSALLLAGVVSAGACEGGNVWSGDASEYTPFVSSLELPQVAFAGDQVAIRVDARAPRGITQLVLAMRGAVERDTVLKFADPAASISEVVNITIPQAVTDTLIFVQASVVDEAGDRSGAREGTVVVFGPPTVSNVLAPPIVQPGSLVSVRVTAFGARNISQIDLVVAGAVSKDTSVAVFPPRTSVTQDIVFSVPATVQDTVVQLALSARDELGATSPSKSMLLPMVIAPPTVQAIVPPTVQAGKVLSMAVSASSARQIAELRIEVRGGFTQDMVVKLTPTRANVVEYIDVPLPANLVVPELRVRAIAVDRANVLSATDVFEVTAPLFAPVISNVTPYWETIAAGHYADFRVQALGDRPISKLRFRWRGFSKDVANGLNEDNKVLPGPEAVYEITPPRLSVMEDVAIETPCVRSDAVFYALVTAYDEDLNLSPIVMSSVYLTGNSLCDSPVDSVAAPDTTTTPRVRQGRPSDILKGRTSMNADGSTVLEPRPAALTSERRRKANGRRARR
jgi:hypothetical protein